MDIYKELEIARLLKDTDLTYTEIGIRLDCSIKTIRRVNSKTGIRKYPTEQRKPKNWVRELAEELNKEEQG